MVKRAFGELESAILSILRSGKRMNVKEVQSLLKGNDKYNTIMTVMLRLAEKGLVLRERVGSHYEYWVIESRKNSFLQQLKHKMFGVRTSEMVSYLIDKGEDITDEELVEIENLIKQAKAKREAHD